MLRTILAALALTLAACDAAAPVAPVAGPNAVELTIKTDPPGATVIVDGAPAGKGPLTLKLNPGPHRLRASMSGYTPGVDTKIQVGATEPKEHTLHLVASH
jgi:hypothetical protein